MQHTVPQLKADDFLSQRASSLVIDVRTPAEFSKGHIPGSINIPLFDNEGRAIVGTLYKQVSREAAILKGLELVGPQMATIASKALALAQNRPVLVYCWRGGMRSGSVAWLLQNVGLKVSTLLGGYKSYRHHFQSLLKRHNWQFINIGGPTGSGKTEILNALKEMGQQVIDLENLACHKGSAFGALGQPPQPSSEHFENLVHEQLLSFNAELPIWLEDESHSIGSVYISEFFFERMKSNYNLFITIPDEDRINRLVHDYAVFTKEDLKQSVLKIKKRLGGLISDQALTSIEDGDFATVAKLVLHYYDKTYAYGFNSRQGHKQAIPFNIGDAYVIARHLVEYQTSDFSSINQ
jgi:tRNA 2-selenouridine synthase